MFASTEYAHSVWGGVMWRYLTGLNRADLKEELGSIGVDLKHLDRFDGINHRFFVKAAKVPSTQLDLLKEKIDSFNETILFSPSGDGEKFNIIFSLSHSALKEFQNKVASFRELVELTQLLRNVSLDSWHYISQDKELKIDRTLIMGILNVTPDSFSDGGKYFNEESSLTHAMEMSEAGADIIDIGGESTRPGSTPVSIDEEWRRISGVIDRLLKEEHVVLSVDTYKSEIARRALEAGAHIINDISGLTFDPAMARVIADYRVPVILMHIKGTPRDMQKNPSYRNLMNEIYDFLNGQCRIAEENGINQIIVDPGIGFGKRPEDNYELIRRIGEFKSLGYPLLSGSSRKSFIGFGLKNPQADRTVGSITSAVYAILNGANIVRVHDVDETRQAIQMINSIENFKAIT
jgi:dihydropteroate synthase